MSEVAAEPVASKKATAGGTQYVILEEKAREGGVIGQDFTFVKNVSARSAHAAIRALGKEGRFVAIPARSFVTVTVKVETKTQLILK